MKLIPLFLMAFVAGSSSAEETRPNILFIMSDDHTSQAVGVYGGRLQHLNPTPTIDALAAEGMVMENAFCQNAICTPSRASIMTGQGSSTNGVVTLGGHLPPERQYLAIEMKKAGYNTAVIGKWHLKKRPEPFDYYKVLLGQGKYFDPFFFDCESEDTIETTYNGKKVLMEGASQMKGHSSDCITDSALDWFENKRDKDKPFFLKLHFKAPHDDFEYAPRYEDYLADVEIPEPENLWDLKNHGSLATRGIGGELLPYIGTSVSPRHKLRNYSMQEMQNDESLTDESVTRLAYQNYLKAYLRCVKGVDDNIKRVVDYMKAEGLYENTLIIYTGDQGFYLGEHDYIDKRWPYDESMRMPFIIRYPGHIKVGRSDAIIENIDYAPTMLDYAGVSTPEYMEGQSFRSIVETGEEPEVWKQSAYYHYWQHMAAHYNPACIAIRDKRYKLIFYYGAPYKSSKLHTPPAWEFYDLRSDPSEDNNIYDNPEYATVIERLKGELKQRRVELGESEPGKWKFNDIIEEFWDYDEADRQKAVEVARKYAKNPGSKK